MWWIWALEVQLPWPGAETNVVYNGRTFNLLPQSDDNFASVAVEAPILEADDVSKAVHRFLSVLSWIDGKGIRTLWNVGNPGWRQPTPRSPYLSQPGRPVSVRSNFDFLPVPKNETAAKALALYREAVSSPSPDGEFLQYFRIVELAHGHKTAENPKALNKLLQRAALQGEALTSMRSLEAENRNVGKQLVVYGRHAVAHGDDEIAIDPDIVGQRASLHRLLPIIAGLAIHTIESHFGVPTQRTYFQRHEFEVAGLLARLPTAVRDDALASAEGPPVVVESPVQRMTIGLREVRYPALTGLLVSQASSRLGGILFELRSPDNRLQTLLHFDLLNRRLVFDVEHWIRVVDDGSAESSEHAADVTGLILGLVGNGELHVWDAESGDVLGRQNPNLPVNIDLGRTYRLLSDEIDRLRADAEFRRGAGAR